MSSVGGCQDRGKEKCFSSEEGLLTGTVVVQAREDGVATPPNW